MSDTEAAELYEHRDDDDEWEDEPADVQVRPRSSDVVSFRLPGVELDRLQDAAEREGVSLSELIRTAIQYYLDGGRVVALDELSVGAVKLILGPEWRDRLSRVSTSAPSQPHKQSLVPNFPPLSQNLTTSEGVEPRDDEPRLPLDA